MTRLNKFIQCLETDTVSFGEMIFPDEGLSSRLGDTDLDWVWFDVEHEGLDFPLLGRCLQFLVSRTRIKTEDAAVAGPSPILGLPKGAATLAPWLIAQALDYGFFGLCHANMRSAGQAEAFVRAARYPRRDGDSAGDRGFGIVRAQRYWGCTTLAEYIERADVWPLSPAGEIILLAKIEDVEGLENVEEIAAVAGLGGIAFGPGDASLSKFGRLVPDSPWLQESNERVLAAGRAAGISVGVTVPPTEAAQRAAVEDGFDWVAVGGENHRRPGHDDHRRVPLSPEERGIRR